MCQLETIIRATALNSCETHISNPQNLEVHAPWWWVPGSYDVELKKTNLWYHSSPLSTYVTGPMKTNLHVVNPLTAVESR